MVSDLIGYFPAWREKRKKKEEEEEEEREKRQISATDVEKEESEGSDAVSYAAVLTAELLPQRQDEGGDEREGREEGGRKRTRTRQAAGWKCR